MADKKNEKLNEKCQFIKRKKGRTKKTKNK